MCRSRLPCNWQRMLRECVCAWQETREVGASWLSLPVVEGDRRCLRPELVRSNALPCPLCGEEESLQETTYQAKATAAVKAGHSRLTRAAMAYSRQRSVHQVH